MTRRIEVLVFYSPLPGFPAKGLPFTANLGLSLAAFASTITSEEDVNSSRKGWGFSELRLLAFDRSCEVIELEVFLVSCGQIFDPVQVCLV